MTEAEIHADVALVAQSIAEDQDSREAQKALQRLAAGALVNLNRIANALERIAERSEP